MTSRERVLAALHGDEPDRVPAALSFYHLDLDSFLPPDLRAEDRVDVLFVRFPVSEGEEQLARRALPHQGDTRLGSPDQRATYRRWRYRPGSRKKRNPLVSVRSLAELQAFPFPEGETPHCADDLARQVADLHERGLAAGGNTPHLGGELFEASWRLRGLENFLIDLVKRPDWAHFLLDRLTALATRNARTLAAAGIDVLALDDDVGMPGGMMISPACWREFFKPRFAAIIAAARAERPELRVLFHSDGDFEAIVGDLMEIGVDAIHPLQPEHMDAARIRARYGRALALWGTVGRQTSFSFDTPAQIQDEVRRRLEALGRFGLILCPAYDIDEPDIPRENVAAFLQAVADQG